MTVWFIDTSVLVHLLQVPGLSRPDAPDQHKALDDFKARHAAGDQFLLPITTVIETGNHICQVKDGQQRRKAAQQLHDVLSKVITRQSPWLLDEVQWDNDFLGSLLDGAATGQPWVEHACQQTLGGGDLSIPVERDQYRARTGLRNVRVWTLDRALDAFSQ